jgi:hypothetical protein
MGREEERGKSCKVKAKRENANSFYLFKAFESSPFFLIAEG